MTLIDPRQYTPYELIFPSGNLQAVQGEDYFNVYLLNSLTGSFNITGSLKLNNKDVFVSSPTNNFGGTNVYVFGGTNNFATGTSNGIIYSFSSEISGQGNGILFGEQNQIVDASYASILAGRNTLSSHTGAVVIGDSVLAREKNSVRNDSFTIDLTGGCFNQYDFFQKGDFYLDSTASGLASGNFNFLLGVFQTGSPLQNLQNLKDSSGTLLGNIKYNSGVYETGINALSGTLVNDYVTDYSAQTISGEKTFAADVYIQTGNSIKSLEGNFITPSYYGNADYNNTGNLGGYSPVISSKRGLSVIVDSANQRDKNDKTNQFSKNAFSLWSESPIPGTGKLCFGVDGSGMAWARQGVIISEQRYVPTGMRATGISGQMSWSGTYFYLCTGNSLWGRVQVAPW